jgi:hypothetical protein
VSWQVSSLLFWTGVQKQRKEIQSPLIAKQSRVWSTYLVRTWQPYSTLECLLVDFRYSVSYTSKKAVIDPRKILSSHACLAMPTAPRVSTTNKPHIDNNKIRAQAGETSIGIGIPNESGSQIPLQSIPLSKVSTSSDTSNQKHQTPSNLGSSATTTNEWSQIPTPRLKSPIG